MSAKSKVGRLAREHLLDVAGRVFAEKGYDRATSKEICKRAGMNRASVNYHFGGIKRLYAETLAHAQRRLVTREALEDIVLSEADANWKLNAFIALLVRRLALPTSSWEMRLLGREFVLPSPAREACVDSEILLKLAVLRDLIAEVIGAAPDAPAVGRTMLSVVAPVLILAISRRKMLTNILPGVADVSRGTNPLIDHLERFILGGLGAVALVRA